MRATAHTFLIILILGEFLNGEIFFLVIYLFKFLWILNCDTSAIGWIFYYYTGFNLIVNFLDDYFNVDGSFYMKSLVKAVDY